MELHDIISITETRDVMRVVNGHLYTVYDEDHRPVLCQFVEDRVVVHEEVGA
jgi:hypothetical protein